MRSLHEELERYYKQSHLGRLEEALADIDSIADSFSRMGAAVEPVWLHQSAVELAKRQGLYGIAEIPELSSGVAPQFDVAAAAATHMSLSEGAHTVSAKHLIREEARRLSEGISGRLDPHQVNSGLLNLAGVSNSVMQTSAELFEGARPGIEATSVLGMSAAGAVGKNVYDDALKGVMEGIRAFDPFADILTSAKAAQQALSDQSQIQAAVEQWKELSYLSDSSWMAHIQHRSLTDPRFAAFEATATAYDEILRRFRDDTRSAEPVTVNVRVTDPKAILAMPATERRMAIFAVQIVESIERLGPEVSIAVRFTLIVFLAYFLDSWKDFLISSSISEIAKGIRPNLQQILSNSRSPQEATKKFKRAAKKSCSSPEHLELLRYIGVGGVDVLLNPKAQSPKLGTVPEESVVRVLQQQKDFTLIAWDQKEGEAQLQGWVFTRHLRKFN